MANIGGTARMVVEQGAPQFYRRMLPSSCVDFASEDGKQLFIGALDEGNMNIYFKLAAQFLTQSEPSFCGLSTLVMVLNALEVDPGRVWKGAWRWYHETMLDCCTPLETVIKSGITADQFECLARCNRLNVIRHNPPPITQAVNESEKRESVHQFRSTIRETVRSNDTVLVVSYCRTTLGQTGLGHFSPVAGYNAALDKVLLMDVARFKYPPHWVDVPLLWESMREIDADTGKPRASFVLSMDDRLKPMLLLRLIDPSTLNVLVDQMRNWFAEFKNSRDHPPMEEFALLVLGKMATAVNNDHILDVRPIQRVQEVDSNGCCKETCDNSANKQLETLVQEMTSALMNTTEYKHLINTGGDRTDEQHRRALLAVGLFFSWPFEMDSNCAICASLAEYCRSVIKKIPSSAQNELTSLKTQILASLGRSDN